MLLASETKNRIFTAIQYRKNQYLRLILQGEKGIGKRMAADDIASKILNVSVDKLNTCPDYMVVESQKGAILIEQLGELKKKVQYNPSVSQYKVFVIDDADMMNVNAQNSLLKLIEDGNATNVFIFVAHKPLLDTIHSRCETIIVKKPSYDEVKEYFNSTSTDMDELIMRIADNRIGLYQNYQTDTEYVETCKDIIDSFLYMKNKREILEIFGQIKEKDNKNFYEVFSTEKVQMFMRYLKEIFVDILCDAVGIIYFNYSIKGLFPVEKCIEVTQEISEHIDRMGNRGRYTKNDFFDLIRHMAS